MTQDPTHAPIEPAAPPTPRLLGSLQGWPLAAYLSVLAFASTMTFEYGVAHYWGYPFELARFSAEQSFLVISVVLVFSVLAYMVGRTPALAVGRWWDQAGGSVPAIVVIIVPVLAVFLGISVAAWAMFGGTGLIVWCCVMFVVGLALQVAGHRESDRHADRETVIGTRWLGTTGAVLVVVLLTIPILTAAVGFAGASMKSEFLVLDFDPPLAVVRSYGDLMICVPANPDAEVAALTLISRSGLHGVDARRESIAMMRPVWADGSARERDHRDEK